MKRVLIIEDEAVIRIAFERLLRNCNCIIDKARNADNAVELLANFPYDLILLDLVIPPYELDSGFRIIQKLRKIDLNQAVPIIIVTGRKSEEEVKRKIKLDDNVVEILIKPVSNEKLLSAVQRILEPGCPA